MVCGRGEAVEISSWEVAGLKSYAGVVARQQAEFHDGRREALIPVNNTRERWGSDKRWHCSLAALRKFQTSLKALMSLRINVSDRQFERMRAITGYRCTGMVLQRAVVVSSEHLTFVPLVAILYGMQTPGTAAELVRNRQIRMIPLHPKSFSMHSLGLPCRDIYGL